MNDEGPSNLPSAGWFPDNEGRQRWWDGQAWTGRLQADEAVAEETHATTIGPPAPPTPLTPHPVTKTPSTGDTFFKKKWFIGLVAGVAGIVLGAAVAGTSKVEDDPKYKEVSSQLDQAQSDRDDAQSELDEAEAQIGDLPDREAAAKELQSKLTAKVASLKSQDSKLRKREKAVGIVEKDIESNTVAGEGVYQVGQDIKPGQYKSKGSSSDLDCYWSVNADSNGSNIIANGLSTGPQVATVAKGQYFETSNCEDWIRQ